MAHKSDEILNVAIKLFSEIGYHATSMRLIAKEANIVQSSIYNHYKNKEALLIEIAKLMNLEIESTFELTKNKSRQDDLRKYIENIMHSVKTKTQFWRLFHSIRMNKEAVKIIKKETKEMQKMIVSNLRNLFGTKKLLLNRTDVLLFWAAIDGIVAAYLLIDNYPIKDVLTGLIKTYK